MRRALALLPLCGCLYTTYVAQAAHGELDLLARAKPIDQVVRDPDTPIRVAALLAEIPAIKQYGRSYGLHIRRNYETYSRLDRPAAVWFVGAADPIRFEPVPWCFPIAGCFPGLGWFDEDDAVKFEQMMEDKGLDAMVRPAAAFSTGGWFPDPVLSTMVGGGNEELPWFTNTILHESVHATVFIEDQQFFNESFAAYIADTLTDAYIATRFGPGSPEDLAWTLGEAISLPRVARQLATYRALKSVYENKAMTRAQKLTAKAKIIDDLVADLRLRRRPNNATINDARLYNGGTAVLKKAHEACGDLRSLLESAKTLKQRDFSSKLQEDLTSIGALLAQRCRTRSSKPRPG